MIRLVLLSVLACCGTATASVLVDFGTQEQFFFGLATAPAQAEDELDGPWVEFAEAGHVAAWKNQPRPAERLRFWTEPEVEINLAKEAGVAVFRTAAGRDKSAPCAHMDGARAIARIAVVRASARTRGRGGIARSAVGLRYARTGGISGRARTAGAL